MTRYLVVYRYTSGFQTFLMRHIRKTMLCLQRTRQQNKFRFFVHRSGTYRSVCLVEDMFLKIDFFKQL